MFNARNPMTTCCCRSRPPAISEVVGRSQMDFVLLRRPRRDRQERRNADAGDARSLRHRHPDRKRVAAGRAAARAGARGVRRRGEGGGRIATGRRTRGRPTPTTSSRAPAGWRRDCCRKPRAYNARVVQEAEGNASRFRADPRRVQQGAGDHARTALPRHDAVGARQHEQGADRPEERQQPALPAARSAAQAIAGGRSSAPRGRRGGTPGAGPEASTALDPSRSRELPRARERGDGR